MGIVGAGLAGLATCYELLQGLDQEQARRGVRVEIQVMDRHGIAAGWVARQSIDRMID